MFHYKINIFCFVLTLISLPLSMHADPSNLHNSIRHPNSYTICVNDDHTAWLSVYPLYIKGGQEFTRWGSDLFLNPYKARYKTVNAKISKEQIDVIAKIQALPNSKTYKDTTKVVEYRVGLIKDNQLFSVGVHSLNLKPKTYNTLENTMHILDSYPGEGYIIAENILLHEGALQLFRENSIDLYMSDGVAGPLSLELEDSKLKIYKESLYAIISPVVATQQDICFH